MASTHWWVWGATGGVAPPPLRESTLEFKGSYPGSRASSQAENVLEAARQEEQPLHRQEEQPLENRPLLRRPPLHLPMATMTTTPTTANPETLPCSTQKKNRFACYLDHHFV